MKQTAMWIRSGVMVCVLPVMAAAGAQAQNPTTVGDFMTERPTLVSLGFEWRIAGDDNRNAKVEVSYRAKGETKWREAMPLLRLQGEKLAITRSGGTWR